MSLNPFLTSLPRLSVKRRPPNPLNSHGASGSPSATGKLDLSLKVPRTDEALEAVHVYAFRTFMCSLLAKPNMFSF